MVKIKIKNSFWKQEIQEQIKKLMQINFYLTIIMMINIIYSLIIENIFMIITNTFITIFMIILNLSYDKRDKNDKKN